MAALLAVAGKGDITAVRMAGEYATDGRAIGEYFDTILYNTEESDLVLCAFSDRELNIATECYLQANGHTL